MTQPESAPSAVNLEIRPQFEVQALMEQRDAAMNDAARWKAAALSLLVEKGEAEQEILRLREKVAADEEPGAVPAGIPLPPESRAHAARRGKTPAPQ